MKFLYCSPNKSHHYRYAEELHAAGMLHAFVSGFPRCGAGAAMPVLGDALVRADHLQLLYLASLRAGLPKRFSGELAHCSKLWIDHVCSRHLDGAEGFLFYSGCGLGTARKLRKRDGLSIVEAVNSHVLAQQDILREEHTRLGISWSPFHRAETRRRLQEYEESDRILVPSEFVRRSFLEAGFSSEKILKAPYRTGGFSGGSPSLPPEHRDDDDVFRILFVGSISLRKGVRYLVEAFRKFRHPRKELWLVGPLGSPSGLEDLTLPEGVRFLGVLKGDQLAAAYRNASLFCLPTLEEGLALVLAEALMHGLPVVTTANSGGEDLFTDGLEGILTAPRDAEEMARTFERCVHDPGWFAGMRGAAVRRGGELLRSGGESPLLATLRTVALES